MRKDILYDSTAGDLVIQDGDFRIGPSDLQHVFHIILVSQGSWKQFPLTGVGEAKLKHAPLDAALRRQIHLQLEADGYRLNRVAYIPDTNELDVNFDPATI
jgi:hypothetical protein